ncbi:T9SS-dependent choice-of-anchor J family protein [Chryseobacterium sp. SC28]|uniref:T9SS-dependent choice-of-anchor J family protein n=1 Tax=Chryseobacterium sp. SC28 TaxID=2268028 RepID=UPI000F64DD4A|nr:choice-of-anchor J domain-containing protein [Chryseobacterium sp. SC28]RRQ47311.1 T9SS C-terminal target domain-containing protein [Chryseobacterium sp. SC28]
MKKLLFAALLASAMGNAQSSIFTENFEDITDLQTAGWTLYNDSNTPYGSYATLFTNAWEIVSWSGESGNTVASSPSWFTTVAPADRWLVSPAITIPANNSATLEFFARSHDTSPYDDGFKLKISTTNTAKTSFTDILAVDHAVNAPIADQTPFQIDLSSYAGKTVYLAWVNDYTNGNLLSIDDINITTTLLAVDDINKKDVTLYPNPVVDYFKINNTNNVVAVKIYDLSGKAVKNIPASVDNKFDVSDLEKGIYTIAIETKSGIVNKKIIKK